MASLSDILTATKNIVTALNGAAQTYLGVQGTQSTAAISAATLVQSGTGRVCEVIVTTAGVAGAVYDATSVAFTTGKVFVIPATLGVYVLNCPINNGLVVAPGAGQVVTVTYS